MRKVRVIAVLATMGLAVPFTLLALVGAAWFTENLIQVTTAVANAARFGWLSLLRDWWVRWPELAGMAIGQLLVLLILVLARGALRPPTTEQASSGR